MARVPLRKWISDEAARSTLEHRIKGADYVIQPKKWSILRKASVSYGIVELLLHAELTAVRAERANEFSIDNFVVHVSRSTETFQTRDHNEQSLWDDVRGVSMISPSLSALLSEPSFVSNIADENIQGRMGRYFEVEIVSNPPIPKPRNTSNMSVGRPHDKNGCRLLGILLHELYSGICPLSADYIGNSQGISPRQYTDDNSHKEPPRKLPCVRYDKKSRHTHLHELGYPSSICVMVQNLIDGDSVYSSLDDARSDIHLSLSDPDCFLFDIEDSPTKGGCIKLRIKRGKMYGRENEASLITDQFCRVSSGENAAFFIGGYSGSGKTMLVQSILTRIDIAGGYVLSQKLDQMALERPLLGVLSAFDRLCLLIRDKCTPNELLDIANKLMRDFESDLSVLARLLPNIISLFPQLENSRIGACIEQMMNLHTICFTLQRFMRIVSSRLKPIMLFLDDLQWAANPTLELIQALLLDTVGPSCFLFVGCYRDNETRQGHPVLKAMSSLEASPIHTTLINLRGLRQNDLNLMIAETLGVFPRLCKPLSDIVLEKTKGNPLFALEFLRSLVDSRLLKYHLSERRWIWEKRKIADENITESVVHLLTSQMTSLPEKTQLALRILSCFGIKLDESIVGYFSSLPQYSDILGWLNHAIEEGCILKAGSEFKFVHDKVREAAYGLIPDRSKSEFHYNLGMTLLSAYKGQDMGDSVYNVVDQLNHGIPSLIQPSLETDIADLNFRAGSRAMGCSDFETAQLYLNKALAILPNSHWITNYEFSLRLFIMQASVAYSRGNIGEAYGSLKKIIEEGRRVEDTLDAHYLYATILHACEESDEAYTSCQKILRQLNETIPDSVDIKELMEMIKETGQKLQEFSYDDLMVMKEADSMICFILKFYTLLLTISHWKKPGMMVFYACRIVRLSLDHGLSHYSVLGFLQFAAVRCQKCKIIPEIQEADRVAKVAMALFKQRFNLPEIVPKMYLIYYGFIAFYTQPIQMCTNHLRKGFEVGISVGDPVTAFYNSLRYGSTALMSGENLTQLLKEADHHLEIMARLHLKLSMPGLSAKRETISILIDKGQSTGYQKSDANPIEENIEPNEEYAQSHKRVIYLNRMLQSFWLGYSQRCHHYAMRALVINGGFSRLTILFYTALNAFRGVKNNNGSGSQFMKIKEIYKDAVSELRNAAEICPWNFRNKVYLLEAELYSFQNKRKDAKASYAAAITSSISSRLVHEQGLSCELAALHFKKTGDHMGALNFFSQARECYTVWGSQMKVNEMGHQLEMLIQNTLNSN